MNAPSASFQKDAGTFEAEVNVVQKISLYPELRCGLMPALQKQGLLR
jgi:hypothetical protein